MNGNIPENKKIEDDNPELRYGKMKNLVKYSGSVSLLAVLMLPLMQAQAGVFVQCPGDEDGDAVIDTVDPDHPNAKCMHLSGGDGFANMADGYLQYIFGFGNLTGVLPDDVVDEGLMIAQISAPTIKLKQGEEFYLSLTNTGMLHRPDLSDAHTVHFHGFPQASSVFDGVPDASIGINMGATLTYYYNIQEPGTYLYHCHVEAAEHMQMGMQGNLYVHPQQDGTSIEYPVGSGRYYTKFAYNDVDGSTGYDVEMPLQITGFDPVFHDANKDTQPLPFADMKDTYHMFNGRGYPMTVQADNYYEINPGDAQTENVTPSNPNGYNSQPYSSRQEVIKGQKLLVRITNLSVTQFHTVTALGLPMKVVGQGAKELAEKYDTSSVNLGGGESIDVVIDTENVEPGTYFMYITELNQLSNDKQSFGGPMTEIVVKSAI